MPPQLFIPQEAIAAWVAAERAEMAGDLLWLGEGDTTFRLGAASLFRRVSAGSDEAHRLLGRVKSEQAILGLGGESYMTSVIVGETAYEVEPGYLAVPTVGTVSAPLVRRLVALTSS